MRTEPGNTSRQYWGADTPELTFTHNGHSIHDNLHHWEALLEEQATPDA